MSIRDWVSRWWPPRPKPPLPTTTTTTPSPVSLHPTTIDLDLFQAHNQSRVSNGRSPLRWSDQLYRAARAHSSHMASVGRMAHEGIGDGDPWQRIQTTGYRFRAAGENVAGGYQSVEGVMQGWMGDSPHRANILGNYTEMGCSMTISSKGVCYWCADFATPAVGFGLEKSPILKTVTYRSEGGVQEMSSTSINPSPEQDG